MSLWIVFRPVSYTHLDVYKRQSIHSALNHFVNNEDYHIKKAFVLSNERTVQQKEKILYIPIYYIMFFHSDAG